MKLLHSLLNTSSYKLDRRLIKGVFACVESALAGGRLYIASLGRNMAGPSKPKHKIKRVDRLFSNPRLHESVGSFYKNIGLNLISPNERPIIIIDGSWFSDCGYYQFLSASLPIHKRAIPVYEQAFLRSEISKPKVLKAFLEKLKSVLPEDCKPIIVTDAGFKNPWFKQIKQLGWDYIGRSASSVHFLDKTSTEWRSISTLDLKTKSKPEFIMTTEVTKNNPMTHSIYRYKAVPKGRIKKTLYGKRANAAPDNKYANRAKQAWLLFSSLPTDEYEPKDIINIYKKRMHIEEGFRDLKNEQLGLGLDKNNSRILNKISVALLIGALVRLMLTILGCEVKSRRHHYSYQANSIKHRDVLSVITIARQFLSCHLEQHRIKDPWSIVPPGFTLWEHL